MQHLFDVVGLPNGSTTTKIFTSCTTPNGSSAVCLRGDLVWCSQDQHEFYLELAENCELALPLFDEENPDLLDKLEPSSTDSHRGMIPGSNLSYIKKLLKNSFGLRRSYFTGVHFVSGGIEDSNSPRRIEGSLYRRMIVQETSKGVDSAGLWAGLYGPHGLEIINVSYTEEEITATKVLGDPNVPCEQVTFKARIASKSSTVLPILQAMVNLQVGSEEEPFTIVKWYQGYGQIAETGYQYPQWVTGQLLIAQQSDIAFMWQDDNFIIPFKKLHLPSIYEEQKEFLALSIM